MAISQPYKPKSSPGGGRVFRNYLLLALLISAVMRFFLVEGYTVQDNGMMPGHARGDRLAVNRFAYGLPLPFFNALRFPRFSSPSCGDRVVFYDPRYPVPGGFSVLLDILSFSMINASGNVPVLLRRTAGEPGDLIRIDGGGVVWRNGRPWKRTAAGVAGGMTLFREEQWTVALSAARPRPPFPAEQLSEASLRAFVHRFLQRPDSRMVPVKLRTGTLAQAAADPAAAVVVYNSGGVFWRKERGGRFEQVLVFRDNAWWFRVPQDSWFVLADARRSAADSRDWGLVPRSHLIGPVLFRLKSAR